MADINTGSMQHAIVKAFDESSESLKTTVTNAAVEIAVSAFTDSIKIGDANGDTVTTSDMGSGIQALDVNVRDITLSHEDDSIETHSVNELSYIDEVSSSVSYFGFAPAGSAEGSALWKIKKLTVSGTVTKVQFADGNALYDNVWNNRASLSYS